MAQQPQTISFLDTLRRNRVGALLAGLIVMIAVALLLSAAVPDDLNTVIALLLIVLLGAAVGFAVRLTAPDQGAATMFTAGALAALGTPIMFDTGSGLGSFDESLLASFRDSPLFVAAGLAAIVAIIVAAWGRR